MKKLIIFLVFLIGFGPILSAQKELTQDERMQWWRDARFGMFIHWGLYAVPAGEWNGKQIDGIGEWIMKHAQIPVAEYHLLAGKFNPVKFNAHDFVSTAKNAGMKYITITSKHHDGFAMFKSNATKYNIVDATPYGKDVIKALAEECSKQGLKLCFYYSQSRDWNEPNGLDNDWDFPKERNFQKYLDEKVKPQLNELLTNYGPIGLIWFDTPMDISKEQSQSLKDLVRKLQPACIISGRLGGGVETDYMSTGDNVIPATVVPGDWEVPATLNNTWGFKKNDHEWKSPEALTRLLFDIAAKGGNYLLNVGPTAEGLIPQESVDILSKVGEWMKINSEAVYGTKASPYPIEFKWGNITQKPGKLYLGIFNWPSSVFYLEGLKNKVKKIWLLSDKTQKAISFQESSDKKTNHHRLKIDLPKLAPDKVVSVVVVETEGTASVETSICQQADGNVLLPGITSSAMKEGKPSQLKFTARGGGADWRDASISLTWNFIVEKAGSYSIDLITTETGSHGTPIWQGGQKVKVSCNGQEQITTITDDRKEYNQRSQYWKLIHTSAGKISFDKPGTYELSLAPQSFPEDKIGLTFKEIVLQPDLSKIVIENIHNETIKRAKEMMSKKPVTVTTSSCKRSAGGKHDFYSEGDYWWPDPANPGGPYIQKDGESNPGNFSDHRLAMVNLSEIAATLTSAWLLTGEKKYATKALEHLNAWFVDTTTRMNPDMLYAQAIWGRFTGRGIGLIDAYHLVEVAQSAKILIDNKVIPEEKAIKIKEWFTHFLNWMTTHKYGIDEMNAKNNHGTCWIATASSMAVLVGNDQIRKTCIERFKTILTDQMAKDGSFPLEIKRTKPFGYSLFNIDAVCNVAQILSTPEENLWNYKTPEGLTINKGMEFIYPFIADKSTWPFAKDIYIWEEWPVRQSSLLFAGLAYNCNEYINKFLALPDNPTHPEVIRNLPVRHPAIWILKGNRK